MPLFLNLADDEGSPWSNARRHLERRPPSHFRSSEYSEAIFQIGLVILDPLDLSPSQIEMYAYHLPHASMANLVDIFVSLSTLDDSLYTLCQMDDFKFLADMIQHIKLQLKAKYTTELPVFCICNSVQTATSFAGTPSAAPPSTAGCPSSAQCSSRSPGSSAAGRS